MVPLISYSREHPELSVQQALRSLVETYAQQQAQLPPNINVQGAFPPGGVQRPPGMMQSPALSSAGLPNGVVATPSPHQSNMAPPMAPSMSQTSHQSGGTGGVNTSPNVAPGSVGAGGKRRRSTVKDEEGVNGGGGKVKQSPRMASGNKRMKGT
jgi:hypothetical protein